MSDPPKTKILPKVPLPVVEELLKRYTTYRDSANKAVEMATYPKYFHYATGVAEALDVSYSRLSDEMNKAYDSGEVAIAALLDPRKRAVDEVRLYSNDFEETPGNPRLAKEYAAGIAEYAASLKEKG